MNRTPENAPVLFLYQSKRGLHQNPEWGRKSGGGFYLILQVLVLIFIFMITDLFSLLIVIKGINSFLFTPWKNQKPLL